jgi:hypothetical protein
MSQSAFHRLARCNCGIRSLTAHSIIQNTLSIGGTGAGFADDLSTISQVPEPGTFALFSIGVIGLLTWAWRRNGKSV